MFRIIPKYTLDYLSRRIVRDDKIIDSYKRMEALYQKQDELNKRIIASLESANEGRAAIISAQEKIIEILEVQLEKSQTEPGEDEK